MKVIICGGRDYQLTADDYKWLDELHARTPFTEIVSGAQRGADMCGEIWARQHGIPVQRFPADWDAFGLAAGPMRNRQMANYANGCVAFPGGRGTANMVAVAKELGLGVVVR